MKTKIFKLLFLFLFPVLLGGGCEKEDPYDCKNNLIGTWVEKNPELYDNITDTIVFSKESIVDEHFYFKGWDYLCDNDSITFSSSGIYKRFSYQFINPTEMVINNFLDRTISSQVKNIYFIKTK